MYLSVEATAGQEEETKQSRNWSGVKLAVVALALVAVLGVAGLAAARRGASMTAEMTDAVGGLLGDESQDKAAPDLMVKDDVLTPFGLPDGTIFRCPGNPKVYQMLFGKKSWIVSPPVLVRLYGSAGWGRIQVKPPAVCNSIPNGPNLGANANRVRCGSNPHIFLLNGNSKMWVCDPATYNTFGFLWTGVTVLTMAQCNKICNGPIICNSIGAARRQPYYNQLTTMGRACRNAIGKGTLFGCGTAPIYQMMPEGPKWIPNPPTFNNLYGAAGWKKVITYPPGKCAQVGANLRQKFSNGAKMIRCGRFPHILLLSNGKKRWVCNPSTYNMYSFNWGGVQGLSVGQCKNICTGRTICNVRVGARNRYLLQLRRALSARNKCPRRGSESSSE